MTSKHDLIKESKKMDYFQNNLLMNIYIYILK